MNIFLPDGRKLNSAHVVQTALATSVITFTTQSDTYGVQMVIPFDAGTVYAGQHLLQQIIDAEQSGTGQVFLQLPYTTAITLLSFSPLNFNPLTDTIIINGKGFNAALMGTVYLDDVNGGIDHDGYAFTPTFISTTQISAVWKTSGNEPLGLTQYLLNYLDSLGQQSNALPVTLI